MLRQSLDQVILNRFRERSGPLVGSNFSESDGPIGRTGGPIGPPVHYLKKGLSHGSVASLEYTGRETTSLQERCVKFIHSILAKFLFKFN